MSNYNKDATKMTECPSCDGQFISEVQMLDHFLTATRAKEGTIEAPATKPRKKRSKISTKKLLKSRT